MSPIQREFALYLEDMLQAMQRIEEYLFDLDFETFVSTSMIVDATIRNFEIIGEASKNVPEEIQEKYPEVPWRKMYGLRNIMAHAYFGVDYEMIWTIAKRDLPQNMSDIQHILYLEKD